MPAQTGTLTIPVTTAAPAGAAGRFYYNSTDVAPYWHNGTAWRSLDLKQYGGVASGSGGVQTVGTRTTLSTLSVTNPSSNLALVVLALYAWAPSIQWNCNASANAGVSVALEAWKDGSNFYSGLETDAFDQAPAGGLVRSIAFVRTQAARFSIAAGATATFSVSQNVTARAGNTSTNFFAWSQSVTVWGWAV